MNVNKPCASCQKTVYPMEQLKCLDQFWHKSCFRCEICKTVLNMKNYKGFDKKPYCHAHYPTMKHTPVSDTPELKRALENSQKVSQVKYHEQFEKSKGQKISVAEDPLSQLQKKTQQNISQVAYHNLRDKRQTMEARRSSLDTQPMTERPQLRQHPEPEANGGGSQSSVDMRRMSTGSTGSGSGSGHSVGDRASFYARAAAEAGTVQMTQQTPRFKPGRIEDYDPLNEEYGSVSRMSASSDVSRGPRPSSFQGDVSEETMPAPNPQRSPVHQSHGPVFTAMAQPAVQPTVPELPVFEPAPEPQRPETGDLTPVAETCEPPSVPDEAEEEEEVQASQEEQASPAEVAPENGTPAAAVSWPDGVEYGKQPLYRAAYEYDSQDTDEVSFVEGDIISNGLPIDEGWMYGLVERTGCYGMMPSNYVTPL